jgi:Amt family ammonium transporter
MPASPSRPRRARSGCASVEYEGAFAIGAVVPFVFYAGNRLLLWAKIDDPVDAGPVHAFCGLWGMIATGLFSSKARSLAAYGRPNYGLFYGGGGWLLASQIVSILFIIAWCSVTSYLMWAICARVIGIRMVRWAPSGFLLLHSPGRPCASHRTSTTNARAMP